MASAIMIIDGPAPTELQRAGARLSAAFAAQLLARRLDAEAQRQRRRAPPAEAVAAYRQVLRRGSAPGAAARSTIA